MFLIAFLLACSDYALVDNETVYIEPQFDIHKITGVPPGVDLVFVLDASGSMENNWTDVYREIPDFLVAMSQLNTDWRFTTVSADRNRIEFLGWLTPTTWTLEFDVTAQFKHIENQQAFLETGLDSSFAVAAEHPEILLPQNDLYFVFMSDEKDQSMIEPEHWLNLFSTFKYMPNASVGAGAIVETGQGCGDSLGEGYIEVSQKTIDLCETSWGRVLDPVVNRIEPEDGIISLSKTPEPDSIKVYLDDEQTEYYEYFSDLNAIQLTNIPPVGTTVVVTYYPVD
jgi:hypothetical protein